jgi:zinc transport system permease protein
LPDFLLYAIIAGLLVALVAGPLGSFVVWQRLAYFGDTLAHSALLGIALGLLAELPLAVTITATCCIVAASLVYLGERAQLSGDSSLGIISHSSLALGLLLVSLFGEGRINLEAFLFGDILGVGRADLLVISLTSLICLSLLLAFWNRLLSVTVHPELAEVEGLPVLRLRLLLAMLIAVLVAAAMKVVGVLLITALLIIPASTASQVARSPERMAILASFFAVSAVCCGLLLSWFADTPAGPSVVVASGAMFCAALLWRRRIQA